MSRFKILGGYRGHRVGRRVDRGRRIDKTGEDEKAQDQWEQWKHRQGTNDCRINTDGFSNTQEIKTAGQLLMQRIVAEDHEKQSTAGGTADKGSSDGFPEGSTTGDPGDKDTHVRRIGPVPGPIEDRPPLGEHTSCNRIGVERHPEKVGKDDPHAVRERVEHKSGGTYDEYNPTEDKNRP